MRIFRLKFIFLNIISYFKFRKKNINELSNLSRNEIYKYYHNYFYFKSSKIVREHREYFKLSNRGFGEDAFHALWENLFKKFKPSNVLEIGVYRGQTISLFTILAQENKFDSNIWGLTPLNSSSDEVSNYKNLNYEDDIKENFKNFNLEPPQIFKGYSNSLEGERFINSKIWDLVYVDGSHDYEVVKNDVANAIKSLNKNGLLILDDSSLYVEFFTDEFKFKTFSGHPGPSKVFKEILEEKKLKFLIGVGHLNIFIN